MPLARWNHHTTNTGMTHMRSPLVHNLGIEPFELESYVKEIQFQTDKFNAEEEGELDFILPCDRPSLGLFMHHSQSIIDKIGLMSSWRQGCAKAMELTSNGYKVKTENGVQFQTKNVVLALGIGDQPNWPKWAKTLKRSSGFDSVHHIFDPDFHRNQVDDDDSVVIIGAGISAVQFALTLLETNPNRQITIVSHHNLRESDFDSDPGWLGPKYLEGFHLERDYAQRRTMIQEARNCGSLTPEVMHSLQIAIHNQKIDWKLAKIDNAIYDSQYQKVILNAHCNSTQNMFLTLDADAVVLATGFEHKRPGGSFIDNTIKTLDLETAKDGFPIVDGFLRWQKGLFVMGPLAELEVGTASRNISGARMAARRIMKSPEAQ
ncbi:SidA/IucD/PvdA family monooxygenase [Candidatus Uabimicrobium sp. HlEnr_7]|uniref:SidA/IucD/PvdA family monooxygenase n=1 Tax=Candidatus Uabimicrobium helgolandensis TaxID=3095367 RepID=UPI003556CE07